MGYSGDSLVELVEHMEGEAHATGWLLAKELGDNYQHNIEINTPVETRKLRESYQQTDIDYVYVPELHAYAWEGRVFTEVDYALYVERGTGLWGPQHRKFEIKPKTPGGVLRFSPYTRLASGAVMLTVENGLTKGGPIYAKVVLHPGSPGHAMFRVGAVMAEHEVAMWSREPLALFERMVAEAGKAAHVG